MNKMVTGAVAIAAGTLLIAGGGGTLAVWNATEDSELAGDLTAGTMELAVADGIWTDEAGERVDLASYKIVPGDTLTFEQQLGVDLVGDNIAAALQVTDHNIEGTATNNPFDDEHIEVAVSIPGATAENGAYLFEEEGNYDVAAEITFTFLEDAEGSANAVYSFDTVGFQLVQVTDTDA